MYSASDFGFSIEGQLPSPSIATWPDAIIAAKARARLNKRGVAYAIQWPAGHFSAEDNKPSLRNQHMRVLECDCTGGEYLA